VLMGRACPISPRCARCAPRCPSPSNFMAGIKGKSFSSPSSRGRRAADQLATSLYRAAMSGLLDAAREVNEKGSFRLSRAVAAPRRS